MQTLLQKSKDKFLEVEGKGEWSEDRVPLESVGSEPDSMSDSFFISIPIQIKNEKDFLSLSSFLPLDTMSEGKYTERIKNIDTHMNSSSFLAISGKESDFTRVVIEFDDEDDDEEVEEEENKGKQEKDERIFVERKTELHNNVDDNNDFTRIQITEGSNDSDDDDNGDNEEKENIESSSFTRIVIEDEDEEDEDDNEDTINKEAQHAVVEKKEDIASVVQEVTNKDELTNLIGQDLKKSKSNTDMRIINEKLTISDADRKRKSEELKLAGNEEMKKMNYQSALSLYTQSLELDQSNLLTRNNRSQAYLKLNQFLESVNDATYILENDPTYPSSRTGDKSTSSGPSSDPVSSTVKKAILRRATVSQIVRCYVPSIDFFAYVSRLELFFGNKIIIHLTW